MWSILIEAQKISLTRSSVSQSLILSDPLSLSPAVKAKEMYTHIIFLQLAIAKLSRAVVAS